MMELKDYFKNEENYNIFIDALTAQIDSMTFGGRSELTAKPAITKGGFHSVKVVTFPSQKEYRYWIGFSLMSAVTADTTPPHKGKE